MTYGDYMSAAVLATTLYGVMRAFRGLRAARRVETWFWSVYIFTSTKYFLVSWLTLIGFETRNIYLSKDSVDHYISVSAIYLASIIFGMLLYRAISFYHPANYKYPVLNLPISFVFYSMVVYSAISVFSLIILQYYGYSGYFRVVDLDSLPPWLDPVSKVLYLGLPLLLIIMTISDRLPGSSKYAYFLLFVWTIGGFLSGFKSQVFLPVSLLAVASWMRGQFNFKYVLYVVPFVIMAYAVIEPLRMQRDSFGEVDVFEAYEMLIDQGIEGVDPLHIFDRVINRFDISVGGIYALRYFELGQLPEFKERIDEIHREWFGMAFVPRYFWPDKPLADLGSVLSYEIFRNRNNSVAVTAPASSYIWGGVPAVIMYGVIFGFFTAMASLLISVWLVSPVKLGIIFIVAIAVSAENDYALFHVISVARVMIFGLIVVWLARMFGFVRMVRFRDFDQIFYTVGK